MVARCPPHENKSSVKTRPQRSGILLIENRSHLLEHLEIILPAQELLVDELLHVGIDDGELVLVLSGKSAPQLGEGEACDTDNRESLTRFPLCMRQNKKEGGKRRG